MKTKIVYVLVSSSQDIYLEQAYISMASLKYHMSEVHITLLTDRLTHITFTGIRQQELRYVDEMIVVDLDGETLNAQQRSRQLKTSVRNHVAGDFLFVDCDTVITRPLDIIDSCQSLIAACRDTHAALHGNPYLDMSLEHGHLLGWPIDGEKDYFNSGVIYVKDVPETDEFYTRWNENLNAGYSKRVFMDQPSFNKTNYEMGHMVDHLSDEWNCELKHGIRYLKDAYIVHYLCTNPSLLQKKQLFLLNEENALLEVKKSGEISESIKAVIVDPFKGLAEVTFCLAGDDVFFLKTQGYEFLRKHYKPGKRSLPEWVLLMMWYVERAKNKLLKMSGLKKNMK